MWANVTLGESIGRWMRNTQERFPADERNAKVAAQARRDLEGNLRILDEALDGRAYLTGDFSLVDAHLSSFIDWLRFSAFDVSPWPRIEAWAKRCADRPARRTMAS